MKITKRQLRRIVREVHPDYQGLPQSDIDYYELADDYAMWSKKNGHVTPAASSVMATYFLEKGLEDDHEKHEMLGKAFKVSHDDIMREIELQMADQKAAEEILSTRMGDYSSSPHRKKTNERSEMKISKSQIKKMIREAMQFAPTAQEEAEKINAQTGAGYVTDQAFWEKQGVITGEDLAVSVLNQTYSDFYKGVHLSLIHI